MLDPTATTFFSYSREDSQFVVGLAKDLRAAGAVVWLDQLDIGPGKRWDSAVEEALRRCPRQVVVLTPAAVNSVNVMDEVSFALEQGKQVIPVLYRDCQLPFRLLRVQYIDFRADYASGLQALLRTLEIGGGKAGATQHRQPSESPAQAQNVEKTPEVKARREQQTGVSRKKLWVAAVALGLMALAVGMWYVAPARKDTQIIDAQIISDIHKKIDGDTRISEKNINVSVTKGLVELSGNVGSQAARSAATNDASQVNGVERVINNLQVAEQRSREPVALPTPALIPPHQPSETPLGHLTVSGRGTTYRGSTFALLVRCVSADCSGATGGGAKGFYSEKCVLGPGGCDFSNAYDVQIAWTCLNVHGDKITLGGVWKDTSNGVVMAFRAGDPQMGGLEVVRGGGPAPGQSCPSPDVQLSPKNIRSGSVEIKRQ